MAEHTRPVPEYFQRREAVEDVYESIAEDARALVGGCEGGEHTNRRVSAVREDGTRVDAVIRITNLFEVTELEFTRVKDGRRSSRTYLVVLPGDAREAVHVSDVPPEALHDLAFLLIDTSQPKSRLASDPEKRRTHVMGDFEYASLLA